MPDPTLTDYEKELAASYAAKLKAGGEFSTNDFEEAAFHKSINFSPYATGVWKEMSLEDAGIPQEDWIRYIEFVKGLGPRG